MSIIYFLINYSDEEEIDEDENEEEIVEEEEESVHTPRIEGPMYDYLRSLLGNANKDNSENDQNVIKIFLKLNYFSN